MSDRGKMWITLDNHHNNANYLHSNRIALAPTALNSYYQTLSYKYD
jgi:hypothetical protein